MSRRIPFLQPCPRCKSGEVLPRWSFVSPFPGGRIQGLMGCDIACVECGKTGPEQSAENSYDARMEATLAWNALPREPVPVPDEVRVPNPSGAPVLPGVYVPIFRFEATLRELRAAQAEIERLRALLYSAGVDP